MKSNKTFPLILLGIMLLASHVMQGNATPQDSMSIYATDDAQVNFSDPSRNYGDIPLMHVSDSANSYKAYIKFDVSGFTEYTVTSAMVYLSCTYPTTAITDWYYTIYRLAADWDEDTITYSNAPTNAGTIISEPGPVIAGDGFTLSLDMYWECNDYWLKGENYGFMIYSTHTQMVRFLSSEAAVEVRARMEVTYSLSEIENIMSVLLISTIVVGIVIYKRKD